VGGVTIQAASPQSRVIQILAGLRGRVYDSTRQELIEQILPPPIIPTAEHPHDLPASVQ